MQESKKTLHVNRPGTSEFVPIAVAPGETTQDVLAAIGERGAMALATGGRQSLVFLAPATLWNWIDEAGQALYVVGSSHPC
jgi:hypothetical protein